MLPSKQILALVPPIRVPIRASGSAGDCPKFVRSGPNPVGLEAEATGWELVRSADLAAAASRIFELEQAIEATRWDLRNTVADLQRAQQNQHPACRPSTRCTESVASLTGRQREVLDLVLAGHPSKNIAVDLGISQRTVDNHRAAIMRKTGSKSLPALVRKALATG